MKKTLYILLAIILCLSAFSGCEKPNADTGLPPFEAPTSEGVLSVSISSLPEGYNYSFKGEAAKEVVDYFANLNLITDFTENANEYTGMTWVVTISYDNGKSETIYHSANLFVRREGGSWYKMKFDEAASFSALIDELKREQQTDFVFSGEMIVKSLNLSNAEATTESQLILDLLNNGEWANTLCNCINDYTISLSGKVLRYSSGCGTFNNVTDKTSLTLSDNEKTSVNDYLEKLFEHIDPREE